MASGAPVVSASLPAGRCRAPGGPPGRCSSAALTGRTVAPGYYPVVVKWHKSSRADAAARAPTAGPPQALRFGTLDDPAPAAAASSPASGCDRLAARRLPAARALRADAAAAGFARRARLGGRDRHRRPGRASPGSARPEPVIGWADLAGPLPTFGRSHPDRRSFLERYDFEPGSGSRSPTPPAARPDVPTPTRPRWSGPIVNAECAPCPWWEHLPAAAGRRRPRPADRAGAGWTAGDRSPCAAWDRDGHRPGRRRTWTPCWRTTCPARPSAAGRRAGCGPPPAGPGCCSTGWSSPGRPTDPIEVPAAEIEIDFDIETAADGRIYLWGFLVTAGSGAPLYHEFSRFADLDEQGEIALAREALGWLRSVVEGAAPAGSTTTAGTRWPRSGRSPTVGGSAAGLGGRVRRGAVRRPARDREDPLLRGRRARAQADRPARRLPLARRRPGRAQLPGLVRRGGARSARPSGRSRDAGCWSTTRTT